MKHFKKISVALRTFFLLLPILFFQAIAFAQDNGGGGGSKVDVNITKNDSSWYAQPWVWIVGGAVFLLLLVALLRGGGNNKD